MSDYPHVVCTREENFELRPWGGYMCFLATPELVNSKKLAVGAVLRMKSGLCHDAHLHDDCDEILFVLEGTGRQSFWDEDGAEISYDIHPGDVIYIAKNRKHLTDNISADKELRLFIVNYCVQGQSDPHVKGLIPASASLSQETDYGSFTNVIRKETCGNQSITGNFLTVEPKASFAAAPVSNEELFFILDGSGEIVYGEGEKERREAICKETLGFFHKGEVCSIINTSDVPLRLLHLYTRSE
jgi:oxalate decarboxylase/phosphoglucose isomerase-like protein (cupin superfamily)